MKAKWSELSRVKQYFIKVGLISLGFLILLQGAYLGIHYALLGLKVNTFSFLPWYDQFLISIAIAVVIGVWLSTVHHFKNNPSKQSPHKPAPLKLNQKENLNVYGHSFNHNGFVVNSYQSTRKNNPLYNFNIVEGKSLLLQGQTGAGKTTKVIIPSIINILNNKKRSSVIVTDPKGEIFKVTSGLAKAKDYDIKVINFRDQFKSNRWNPLASILDLYKANQFDLVTHEINELIKKIYLSYSPSKSADFWTSTAMDVTNAVMLAYLDILKQDNQLNLNSFNFKSILHFIAFSDKFVEHANNVLSRDNPNLITLNETLSKKAASKAGGMVEGVKQNIRTSINKFTLGNQILMADNDINPKTLLTKPSIIYIITKDELIDNATFTGIFIQTLYEQLIAAGSNMHEKKACFLILDEFANLPKIEALNNKLSNSRGRKIFFLLATQGFAPLKANYEREVINVLTDNTCTLILGANSNDDVEILSKMCGSKIIKTLATESSSKSTDRSAQSTGHKYQELPYFDANAIRQLKAENKAIYKPLDSGHGYLVNLLISDKIDLKLPSAASLPVQKNVHVSNKIYKNFMNEFSGSDNQLITPMTQKQKNKANAIQKQNEPYIYPQKITDKGTLNRAKNEFIKENQINSKSLRSKYLFKILMQNLSEAELIKIINTTKK